LCDSNAFFGHTYHQLGYRYEPVAQAVWTPCRRPSKGRACLRYASRNGVGNCRRWLCFPRRPTPQTAVLIHGQRLCFLVLSGLQANTEQTSTLSSHVVIGFLGCYLVNLPLKKLAFIVRIFRSQCSVCHTM